MKYISTPRPLLRVAVAAAAYAAIGAGCYAPPPASDMRDSISDVTGIVDPIEYKVVGEKIDEAAASVDGMRTTLSLEDAVRAALRHDPNLQIGLAQVRAALAEARQARLLPNPLLSVVLRFPESGGKAEVEAGLSADLLALLGARRRVDAADSRLRAASAQVLVAALEVVSAVEERWVAVQAADAQAAVLEARYRLVQRLLDLARSRVEAGESSRLDLLTVDAERVEVEAEQIELLARRREHRLTLARLLGQPSSSADWAVPPLKPDVSVLAPERALIDIALERRVDVRAIRWELAALGEEAALARWSWTDGGGIGVEAERDDGWAAGPGGSIPVPAFDWGQARREKANAHVVEARHRLTLVGRQVVEEVRQAVAARAVAEASLRKVGDELLPLSQRRHDQAEAQYRAGEADVTALLQAERQLLAARSKLIQSQQNIALADIRLRRATGGRRPLAETFPRRTPTTASTQTQKVGPP